MWTEAVRKAPHSFTAGLLQHFINLNQRLRPIAREIVDSISRRNHGSDVSTHLSSRALQAHALFENPLMLVARPSSMTSCAATTRRFKAYPGLES